MAAQITRSIRIAVLTAALLTTAAGAREIAVPAEEGRPIDLAIALDVSGSMEGLIDSARQRLWDVVNGLARAQPAPDLRIAIVTYGNPEYGQGSGYLRLDQPFTRDLDAVMETLFAFDTNGGDEYVARAVQASVSSLDWSRRDDALKMLFVAGNEAADQDPDIDLPEASRAAAKRNVAVNTLYCGNANDIDAAGWRRVAELTDGLFAVIDQDVAAVASPSTPFDQEIARLNEDLNDTYLAYGREGERFKSNQDAQDRNAALMSQASVFMLLAR